MQVSEEDANFGVAESKCSSSNDVQGLSPNNQFYISSSDACRIMDPCCFSKEISQFIIDERLFLGRILTNERYECIVEIGCHCGSNSEWLSRSCDAYVGVDVDSRAIERAIQSRRIPGRVEFVCESVERIVSARHVASVRGRKAALFPFNLFGNFINIKRLIQVLDVQGFDVLMSNFNTKSATTIGRYVYYCNCFEAATIRVYDSEQGVLFKAGMGFQSVAFNSVYLAGFIREVSNYRGTLVPFSEFGEFFYLTK